MGLPAGCLCGAWEGVQALALRWAALASVLHRWPSGSKKRLFAAFRRADCKNLLRETFFKHLVAPRDRCGLRPHTNTARRAHTSKRTETAMRGHADCCSSQDSPSSGRSGARHRAAPAQPSFGGARNHTRRLARRERSAQNPGDAFAASRGLSCRGLRGGLRRAHHSISAPDVGGTRPAGSSETLVDDAGRVHEFATVPSSGVFRGRADDDLVRCERAPSGTADQSFRSPRPLASAMYCEHRGGVGQAVFCSTVAACEDLPAVRSRLAVACASAAAQRLLPEVC